MRPIDLDEIEFIKTDGNAEFNHGVDCCINTLLKAPTLKVIKAEVIDNIKAELQKLADDEWNQNVGNYAQGMEDAIEIIDEHISGK